MSSAQLLCAAGIILFLFLNSFSGNGQCKPAIKIDGVNTVVDATDQFGLQLPFWLKEGQTLAVGASVASISVIEFSVNVTALEFSQVLNITSSSPVSVPSGKIWKLESAQKQNNASTYKTVSFTSAGTYSWVVPACAEEICIEIWGGGGGGSGSYNNGAAGAGGGGGGFGSGCFAVVPGTTYTVTVADGGTGGNGGTPGQTGSTGGTSSVGSLITAPGGNGGISDSSGGTGGTGVTSSATNNAQGANGKSGGATCGELSGAGGTGGNGGAGGIGVGSSTNGSTGTAPAGGGSGGGTGGCGGNRPGGKGGAGKVVISW